jgi:di/tricarboxylate transporter
MGFACDRFKNIVSSGSPLKYYVVLCWLLLLSMWMSNTTAMMMLPIVFSVTAALEETHGQKLGSLRLQYCWGIWMLCMNCYISGKPPNLSLSGFLK